MKQSECSIGIIQESVDEVISYWEELYKRFLSLKKIPEQTTEKKVVLYVKFISSYLFYRNYLF